MNIFASLILRNHKKLGSLSKSTRFITSSVSHLKTETKSVIRRELESVLGVEQVSGSESVRNIHGQDEGPHIGAPPDLVVFPRNPQEVSEICKI